MLIRSQGYDLGVIELGTQKTKHNQVTMPFSGYTNRLDVTWPPGADSTIGFKLVVDGDKVLPANEDVEYIASTNTTISFIIIRELAKGDVIDVYIRNESTSTELDLQVMLTVATHIVVPIYPVKRGE